jgi:hypothetical protein
MKEVWNEEKGVRRSAKIIKRRWGRGMKKG